MSTSDFYRPPILGLRLPPGMYAVGTASDNYCPTFASHLYTALPDGAGGYRVTHHGRPTDPESDDVRMLLDYLTGPRRVLVSIARVCASWADVTPVTEHLLSVDDGTRPDDWRSWDAWVRDYASTWLGSHFALPGSYRCVAADTGARELSRWRGLWTLGNHPVDLHISSPAAPSGQNLPAERPRCQRHGPMQLRGGHTAEQQWCGTWYDCAAADCRTSTLLTSPALRAELDEQHARTQQTDHEATRTASSN